MKFLIFFSLLLSCTSSKQIGNFTLNGNMFTLNEALLEGSEQLYNSDKSAVIILKRIKSRIDIQPDSFIFSILNLNSNKIVYELNNYESGKLYWFDTNLIYLENIVFKGSQIKSINASTGEIKEFRTNELENNPSKQ